MNWGWVVSASTLRWWLLKTLPIAWKLLSATNSMPDLYHQALKCLSMVSTHDLQGDLKASLAGGVCMNNNVFCLSTQLYSAILTYLLTKLMLCRVMCVVEVIPQTDIFHHFGCSPKPVGLFL